MIVTRKITIDLARRGVPPRVDAMQGDSNTRKVEVTLFENEAAWPVQNGTTVAVAFMKPDGTSGLYDKLPDNSNAAVFLNNVVTITLAPQVLTAYGEVSAAVIFYDANMDAIATFPFLVFVERNPGAGRQISNNYYYFTSFDAINEAINKVNSCNVTATEQEDGVLLKIYNESISGGVSVNTVFIKHGKNGGVQTVNGIAPDKNGNVEIEAGGGSGQNATATAMDYDKNVKAINHRGYCTVAPENTIPAFIMSKEKGFSYVECDVAFTSDDVPVLLHNPTIDSVSDGTGSIADMTYAEVLKYDFGSWKSENYKGTKIASLAEFLKVCKGLGLHPYIELKAGTESQIKIVADMVAAHGLTGKVSYISPYSALLTYAHTYDPVARIGFIGDVTAGGITVLKGLKGENEIFFDTDYKLVTDEKVALCITNGVPLEIYTANTESVILEMNPYISGVTSDNLIAGRVLYSQYLSYTPPVAPNVHSITNNLTNVNTNNSAVNVEVGTAYSATLTAVDGYTLDHVVVTMGGEDVTDKVYADGVISITSVTGSVVITAVAVSADGRTLVANWDFTSSNVDTIGGVSATMAGNAARDNSGVHLNDNTSRIEIGTAVYSPGRTIEVDVAQMEMSGVSSVHGRFVMIGGNDNGFLYRQSASSPGWTFYKANWGSQFSTDTTLFVGKTCKLVSDSSGYITAYADDTEIGTSHNPFPDAGSVFVGAGSQSGCVPMTITALRIYE